MESLRRKELHCAFKGKLFSQKRQCFKKRKVVSISVVAKKIIRPEEEEERVNHHANPSEQTYYKKSASTFIDDHQVKKILGNWRHMKKIQSEREAARLKLEQIQNTTHFSDNMDSMHDFHKLIGVSFIC